MRFGARPVLTGIIASALLAAATSPVRAACDGNTAGVSVCTGSDAAISKTATGNLDVQFNNQTVTTGGVTISGGAGGFNVDLNVTSASGPNPIANTVSGNAIDISSTGGNVAVTTIAGAPVNSNGTNGIFATTTTGSITINTGPVTTNSTGNGIHAVVTAGGTGGISITTNGVVQSTGGTAILTQVTGGSGNTAITFNADVLYGPGGGPAGIQALSSSTGSITVTGSGNVTGTGSNGAINVSNTAATTSGDLTINTSGNFNNFITASVTQAGNNANIAVTHTGTLSASNVEALTATTAGGGNISITTRQLVQTSGALETIHAASTTGAITINTGAILTNSTGRGIFATTTGGGISITTNGVVQSTGGDAISTQVTGGTGNTAITFNADVLYGAGGGPAGIRAVSSSTGSMTIAGSGNVTGTGSNGAINVSNTAPTTSGDLIINTSGNFNNFITASVTQAGNNANIAVTHTGTLSASNVDALTATTAGGGNISITTSKLVQTSGALETIHAASTTGAITINTGAILTNSTGRGIFATTTGGGISITTNGVVQSTGGDAISTQVTGGTGNTAITFNADVLYGAGGGPAGIRAVSSSTGSMTIAGSGNVTGTGSNGAIVLSNTAATTSGDLIINTSGNFNNFMTASVTQAGNNANIAVTHTGTLSAANVDALTATTVGGGNISITTSQLVQTSGALETIRASTTTGGITINAGPVLTNSTGMGINATTTGGGISIINNGTVTSTGGVAINAAVNGGSGGIAITTNAAVNSQNGGIDAIVAHITGGGTGNIIVNVNAAVTATGNAINLLGGITNTVTNSSTISGALDGIFADHVNVTNAGQITGTTGILTTLGGSSVFDTGTITGTGGTAVQFGAAGNTFTLGPGFTVNGLVRAFAGDVFQLGGTGTASFDASLIGPAAQYRGFTIFNKISDSTWMLTGTNALVLPWTVQQGTLNVTGSLPNSPFTVQNGTLSVDGTVGAVTMNGGVLNGIGTLGGLTVNGGIVAPGHSIGTLNVNGNVSFGAGSTYQVEANAAGQSDKIVATGTATLSGGTVQALPAPGAYGPSTTYAILTANGGRTGTFANVTSSLPFLIPSLSYDANDVFLTLTRNATFLQSQGATQNQRAVAGALDTFPTNNSLFLNLVALSGSPAIRQAFDALSGEVHADLQNSLIDDSRYVRQSVLGRLRQAPYEGATGATSALGYSGLAFSYRSDSPDALAYADPKSPKVPFPVKAPIAAPLVAPTTTFWATGYGAWGRTDSDGNAASLRRDLAGFLVGADRRVDNWWAGLAAGYSHDWIRVPDRASSAEVDSGHVVGYVGAAFGALNLRGGAAYAFHNIDTSRSIVFPGFSDTAHASYHGGTAQAFGEIGYAVATGAVAWEPFGGLAWVHLNTQSFAEAGGIAALNGGGSDRGVGYSTLGLRTATVYVLANGMRLVPRITAAWQHTIGNLTPDIGLAFQSVAAPFAITGVPLARDGALIEAGADLRINPWTSFGLYYNGFLAGSAQDHAVRGKFSMAF